MNHIATSNRRWVTRLTRSPSGEDRRRFQRYDGAGLIAQIGASLHEVDDVSVSGIRINARDLPKTGTLTLTLIPRDGRKLALNEAVQASAQVVGDDGGHTRLRFTGLPFSLAKLLIRHIAQQTGVQPFIFR